MYKIVKDEYGDLSFIKFDVKLMPYEDTGYDIYSGFRLNRSETYYENIYVGLRDVVRDLTKYEILKYKSSIEFLDSLEYNPS